MKKSLISMIFTLLMVSACQTDSGLEKIQTGVESTLGVATKSLTTNLTNNLNSLNPFTKRERDFLEFIENENFTEANALLNKEQDYFQDYFKQNDDQPIVLLALNLWESKHQQNFEVSLQDVQQCNPLNVSNWRQDNQSLDRAVNTLDIIWNELALKLTQEKLDERAELLNAISLCQKKYEEKIDNVITKYSKQIVQETVSMNEYVAKVDDNKLRSNKQIQSEIINRLGNGNSASLRANARRINAAFVNDRTKLKIDNEFVAKLRTELKSDGVISIEDAVEFEANKSGIFGKASPMNPLLKIGYLNLDDVPAFSRHSLPFEAKATFNLKLSVDRLSNSYSNNELLKKYDIIFFKKLIEGEVDRDFKERSQPSSKYQSGTKQIPNPAYPSAINSYENALRRQREADADSELTDACRGMSQCMAAGFAQGLARRKARERTEKAAEKLGNTPQMLTEPVFQNYKYRLVDVAAKKIAKVQIGIIDLRDNTIKTQTKDYQDKKTFSLVYGLNENDPDKARIKSKHDTENKLTSWENKSVNFNVSDLLSLKGGSIEEVSFEGISNVKFFLETSFAEKPKTKKRMPSKTNESSVIADARFNSVVLIETGKGIGTGFYVDSDTILTAYHVVQGHSLVKLKKFDQSKGSGRVVGHDIRLDLALIKTNIDGKSLEIFSGPLPLGASVEAIGHPQGLEFTITRGIVSALRKQDSLYAEGSAKVEFVQSDTPISPGNSGGPLFLDEKVIGVADFGNVKEFSQNLNFSVSFNEVNKFLAKNGIF